MIQIEPHNDSNLIEVTVAEKLEDQDYDRLIPALEAAWMKHDKLRLLWVMKDFKGWKPHALLTDTKMDVKHANDFEKVAMVGEKGWQQAMTKLMKPFTSADVKYFDEDERDEALKWVK